jgi:O-antigen/teichoic acid export membrane protein
LAGLSAAGLFVFSFFAGKIFENTAIPEALRLCSLATFFTYINNYLASVLVYNNQTKYVAGVSVLTSVFSVSFLYLSLNNWHSIKYALLFSQVLTPFLSGLIFFFIAKKHLLFRVGIYRQPVNTIFRSSIPLYVTSLLGSSYVYFSAFFVIFLLGDIEYANYRNGAIEIPFISTIAFSVSAVLLPDLNRYFHEGDLKSALELKKKIINQCIYLLYPVIIFFIVYNYEFIVSYFSIKYAESAIIFAIYSFTCFVRINDYQDVLITAGKSFYILKANIFYFFTNVAAVIILGLLFGIKGVAIAASFSVFSLAFMLLKKDAEIFKIRIADFFDVKNIAVLVLVSLLVSFGVKYALVYTMAPGHLLLFLLGALFYFPVVYFYILRKGWFVDSLLNIVTSRLPLLNLIRPKSR